MRNACSNEPIVFLPKAPDLLQKCQLFFVFAILVLFA